MNTSGWAVDGSSEGLLPSPPRRGLRRLRGRSHNLSSSTRTPTGSPGRACHHVACPNSRSASWESRTGSSIGRSGSPRSGSPRAFSGTLMTKKPLPTRRGGDHSSPLLDGSSPNSTEVPTVWCRSEDSIKNRGPGRLWSCSICGSTRRFAPPVLPGGSSRLPPPSPLPKAPSSCTAGSAPRTVRRSGSRSASGFASPPTGDPPPAAITPWATPRSPSSCPSKTTPTQFPTPHGQPASPLSRAGRSRRAAVPSHLLAGPVLPEMSDR